MLWLGAMAAVPLAAHLVSRARPPEKRLPTVEFLRRAVRKTWRWRRPQDLLLLLLRTLAIAALAFAFVRPVWTEGGGLTSAGAEKHLVLVVDRSGSMGMSHEGQTRFSRAKALALEALRGAGRVDSVNLVWIDAAPKSLYPAMGRTVGPVEAALRDAEVTGEPGDTRAAVQVALDRLSGAEGTRELIVVSDFQEPAWSEPLPPIGEGVSFIPVAVGGPVANLSLASVEAVQQTPLAGEATEVLCRVLNRGAQARTVRVTVTLGEQRHVRELQVEPWGEGQALVSATTPAGEAEHLVKATLEGADDALRADDTRSLVLRGRDSVRVALAMGEGTVPARERETWERLVRSYAWTQVVSDPADAHVLLAAGNDEALRRAAAALLFRGGGLIFRPTEGAPVLGDFMAGLPLANSHADKRPAGETGWGLKIKSDGDSLFRLFATGEYGDPSAGRFSRRWKSLPGDGKGVPEAWRLLMAYEDEVPAVWRGRVGNGEVWWWNLAADPAESTWPVQAAFLPLVGEALLLSQPKVEKPAHADVPPGSKARWAPGSFPEGGEVVLLGEEGQSVPLLEDADGGLLAYRSVAGLQPGVYRWALREQALERDLVVAHTVVNFPESEMDGRTLTEEAIARLGSEASLSHSGRGRPDWEALRDGRPLWPWLVAAGLVFLALEALLLLFGRRDPAAAVSLSSPAPLSPS